MEKTYKPVPECEALRYKGTKDKPDIKIFVSHRIDLDAQTIDNPLYIPVRCGAVYDKRENVEMLGDDTGDNISDKRMSFNELTVQYWAWKNVEADYYGLCHYRRYLSFHERYTENQDFNNHVVADAFGSDFVEKYNLKESEMRKVIENNEIVTLIPLELDKLPGSKKVTVYESLEQNPNVFVTKDIDKYREIFKEKYPEYAVDVDEYFDGYIWRAFNCFILDKKHYFEYNELLFDILDRFLEDWDPRYYNQEQMRMPGYFGEITFGIYYHHLKRLGNLKSVELQVVKVNNVERTEKIHPAFSNGEGIPVVVASSNEYVPFLSTLLCSIRDNASPRRFYDLIVLSNKISKVNREILKGMFAACNNISLRFIEAGNYLAGKKLHTAMHVTTMTYLRLAMLDLLEEYDKAIYLDCDMVLNADIAELYDTDVENYYIAAAVDTVMSGWCNGSDKKQMDYNENKLKLKEKFHYFNAGTLLLNIKEFKKHYTTADLFEIACSEEWKWFDQDVLNMVCEGHVRFLDNAWNVMVHLHNVPAQLPEFFAPLYIYEGYQKALENPKCIHYAGRVIPCFAPMVDLAGMFWKHARSSPYYELILSKMAGGPGYTTQAMHQLLQMHGLEPIPQTGIRNVADVLMPYGSTRRRIAKAVFPKDSPQWNFCKKVFRFFKPVKTNEKS